MKPPFSSLEDEPAWRFTSPPRSCSDGPPNNSTLPALGRAFPVANLIDPDGEFEVLDPVTIETSPLTPARLNASFVASNTLPVEDPPSPDTSVIPPPLEDGEEDVEDEPPLRKKEPPLPAALPPLTYTLSPSPARPTDVMAERIVVPKNGYRVKINLK